MKKNLSLIILSGILCVILSVSAFAEDIVPVEFSEPSEPETEVTLEEPSEPSELPSEPSEPVEGEESLEPSETPSEPSESSVEYTLDGATVNVSQESIEAIAKAVATASEPSYTYDYQYSFIGTNGITYTIDTNEESLSDYDFFISLPYSGSTMSLLVYPKGQTLVHNTTSHKLSVSPYGQRLTTKNNIFAIESFDTSGGVSGVFSDGSEELLLSAVQSRVVYASDHLICNHGDILFESPFSPPVSYTVSFDTGFDDLELSDQSHLDLVLPTPEYPGYMFLGWYLDSDFDEIYTNDFVINEDITLYARWDSVPPMGIFHQSLFDSLGVFVSCEPILYIISLMGLIVFIASAKRIISSRL